MIGHASWGPNVPRTGSPVGGTAAVVVSASSNTGPWARLRAMAKLSSLPLDVNGTGGVGSAAAGGALDDGPTIVAPRITTAPSAARARP